MFLCTEKGEKKPHDSKPGICNVEIMNLILKKIFKYPSQDENTG